MKKLISLLLAGLLSLVPISTATAEEGNVKVGVFLINWSDDTTRVIDPALANDQMFIKERSVAAFYRDTTYGQIQLYGDTLGYFTVNPPKSEGCAAWNWAEDAKQQLAARGVDPNQYNRRIFMWTNAGCPYTGKAAGADIYINYLSSGGIIESVIAHELGHTFGLDHANYIRCTDKLGNQVSIYLNKGDTCVSWEYGDRYDTMGNSSYFGFSAVQRSKVGWLPTTDTQRITTAGTYSLVPLEWASGTRQLEVVPPKAGKTQPWSLCLEVRQSYGWDQFNENGQYGNPWATRGIHIRQHQSCLTSDQQGWFGGGTRLIDANPTGDNQLLDTPLPLGQTFIAEGVTIKLLSVGPNGASVEIKYSKGR